MKPHLLAMEVLPHVSNSLAFSSLRFQQLGILYRSAQHSTPAQLPPTFRFCLDSAHHAGSLSIYTHVWKTQGAPKSRLTSHTTRASSSPKTFFPSWAHAFYHFTRPYCVLGTVVGVISVSFLAVESLEDISLHFVIGVVQVIVLAILSHIYVVGVNQVFDLEIDKVNKPYLPLASGEFSLNRGISLTIIFATVSFAFATYTKSKPLMWYATLAFLNGTGYSVEFPFLRWKQRSSTAILSIAFCGGILVPFCTYPHMKSFVLGRSMSLSRPVIFLSSFICILLCVIAVFKDIPDLEGDRAHGMKTYTIQLGQKRAFRICIYTLLGAYGGAMLVGLRSKLMWTRMAVVLGHAIPASILWHRATRANPKDKEEMQSFYMFLWKLLYTEYFLAQFMR